MERCPDLARLLGARSCGKLRAGRDVWWHGARRVQEAACWDASLRLRPACVLHQDAITQMELGGTGTAAGTGTGAWAGAGAGGEQGAGSSRSGGGGGGGEGRGGAAGGCGAPPPAGAMLAVAQANQHVRVVPYDVLQSRVREAEEAAAEAAEAAEGEEGEERGEGAPGRGGGRGARQGAVLGWEHLAGGGGGGGGGGGARVLTVATHAHVAGMGWDPVRPGRLALVDRTSAQVTLLDLGGAGGQPSDYRRSYLTLASATRPAPALVAFGSAAPAAPSTAAAAVRSLTYLRYGSPAAPYTLAAAGRGGGEAAAVVLWDERRGRAPVAVLPCPGGCPLVAPMEASADGTALLGVVQPGTLVLWDVRRASCSASAASLLSLGASAPAPSAVAAAWPLGRHLAAALAAAAAGAGSPLAAGGLSLAAAAQGAAGSAAAGAAGAAGAGGAALPAPAVSSVALDPSDPSRLALVLQDGSSALWSLAAARITHARPCPAVHPAFPYAPPHANSGPGSGGAGTSGGGGGGGGGSGGADRSSGGGGSSNGGGSARGAGPLTAPPSWTTAHLAPLVVGGTGLGGAAGGAGAAWGPAQAAAVAATSTPSLGAAAGLLGAPLYGTWDADVNGFWSPAAVWEDLGEGALAWPGGAAGVGSSSGGGGAGRLGPGLALMDCRGVAAVQYGAGHGGGGGARAAGVGAAAGVPLAGGAGACVWAAAAGAAVPLQRDWPLCVTCVPWSGELLCGTLSGKLLVCSKR